ncbi:MAG: NAD(+) synthase [Lentisphaeria bacterium]|nr:NAD(+) synthase [Lentisphaeria bacterium]
MFGFFRTSVCSPKITPGDVASNGKEILRLYRKAVSGGASIVFFPSLALTGESAGELFLQDPLLREAEKETTKIAAATKECVLVFGAPVCMENRVFDCFVIAQGGKICGMIPSPDFDGRFFASPVLFHAENASGNMRKDTLFDAGDLTFSLYTGNGYSGADIVFVSKKSPAIPGKEKELCSLAENVSRENHCCCVVLSGNAGESTSGRVRSGASVIASDGKILSSIPILHTESALSFADADLEALRFLRRKSANAPVPALDKIPLAPVPEAKDLRYASLSPAPYLPETEEERLFFAEETLSIQSFALAHRMKVSGAKKMVLGISGGLDSTLALLVLDRVRAMAGLPKKSILAVTMPGFGTTSRTKNNALLLAEKLEADVRTVPIVNACRQHFKDIGHEETLRNAVYENAQARERTQILMDLANKEQGLVIGTGDLSESSMGWCTYNGDQMAMYNVNSAVMKSVIPVLLKREMERIPKAAKILQDVIDTPVSPELLPSSGKDAPGHRTEEILGAYEIHDFFIHAFCHWGYGKEKILFLAEAVLGKKYGAKEIERCYAIFMRRFFTQQFKRSASPEGVNANRIALSPDEWRVASDVSGVLWN